MQMTGSRFDHRRLAAVGILAGLLTLAIAAGGAAPARAATTCSWGGNALAPTGWFTVDPGDHGDADARTRGVRRHRPAGGR